MNIYLRELKANLKSIIIWSLSIITLIMFGMIEYSSLSESGGSFTEMLDAMPKSLQAIIGVGSFDLDTALGYYTVLYLYLVLMTTIHAAMIGAGIISKEERDKTYEFLMTKPISRKNVIISKLLSGSTNIFVLNIVTLLASLFMFGTQSDEAIYIDIIILMFGMFFLQLLFFSIGSATAALENNPKFATGFGTGVLLATFFISIIIDMSDKLTFLKYITPFSYFDAETLLLNEGFNPYLVFLSLISTIILLFLTSLWYNKRDLGS